MEERLWSFKCPFCGKADVFAYRKKFMWKKRQIIEFSYIGQCCNYYPHENQEVLEAIKRLPLSNFEMPPQVCVD